MKTCLGTKARQGNGLAYRIATRIGKKTCLEALLMKNNNVSKQEDARRQYTINITKNAIYKLKQNVS